MCLNRFFIGNGERGSDKFINERNDLKNLEEKNKKFFSSLLVKHTVDMALDDFEKIFLKKEQKSDN